MKEPQWVLRETVLAARELGQDGYAAWLRKHSRKA
jgi:hypothetical protein